MDVARRRILKTIGSGLLYWSLPNSGVTNSLSQTYSDRSNFNLAWNDVESRNLLLEHFETNSPFLVKSDFRDRLSDTISSSESDNQIYTELSTYYGELKNSPDYAIENSVYKMQYFDSLHRASITLISPYLSKFNSHSHLFLGEEAHLYNRLFLDLPITGDSSALCIEFEPDPIQDMFCSAPIESPVAISNSHFDQNLVLTDSHNDAFDIITAYHHSHLFTGGYSQFNQRIHSLLPKGGLLLSTIPPQMSLTQRRTQWVITQLNNAFNRVPWQKSLLSTNGLLQDNNNSNSSMNHNFRLLATGSNSLSLLEKIA